MPRLKPPAAAAASYLVVAAWLGGALYFAVVERDWGQASVCIAGAASAAGLGGIVRAS